MHPYYEAILAANAESARACFHQVTPQVARDMMRTALVAAAPPLDLPDLALVRDQYVGGPAGTIAIRRYVPSGKVLGTAAYFHSGGWVVGTLDHADNVCRRLADAAGCELFSVDYRLAPEHPWPLPLEDAYSVIVHLAETRPGPLMLVGESAGGNLAAACAIRARDECGPSLAGQVLAYPVTDFKMDTDSYREFGDKNWLLSSADMRWFWDHYCPAGIDRTHPWISPLRVGSVAGLPPAFVRTAELDPLRDEGLAFARALEQAGISTDVACDADMLHGYWGAAGRVAAATEAVKQAGEWMRKRFHSAIDDNGP